MSSVFMHAGLCIRILFLLKAEQYFIVCMYHILFIHSSFHGHLGCSYLSIY
jgi:hypothetical protein